MDIHAKLPDVEGLGADEAAKVWEFLRKELRPHMIMRLASDEFAGELTPDREIDRLELDFRLREIDAYTETVEAIVTARDPLVPAHLMTARLEGLQLDGTRLAEARAPLFFSPESKHNVHGPIMIYHAASLAQHLLASNEEITALESAAFSKMVIHELHMTVYDPAGCDQTLHKHRSAEASVSGRFRTSAGRKLAFYGIAIPDRPVMMVVGFNAVALGALPEGFKNTRRGDTFRVVLNRSLPDAAMPSEQPDAAICLMCLLDALLLLMVSDEVTPDQTKLLVGLRDVPVLPNVAEALTSGVTVEIAALTDKARRWREDFLMIPVEAVFEPLHEKPIRLITAHTDLPYYRLGVG